MEIFQDVIMEKSILVPGSHFRLCDAFKKGGGGSEETYYILATCIFPIKTKRCFFNLVQIYIMIRNPTEERCICWVHQGSGYHLCSYRKDCCAAES